MRQELLLSFAVILGDEQRGPCFHRWVPHLSDKPIVLEPHQDVSIRVAFDPSECHDGGLSPQHLGPDEIKNYGRVVAGPLRGIIELRSRPEAELKCVSERVTDDPSYVTLGKFVIQDVLGDKLSRLIDLLRINYGQYWIHPLQRWDSRTHSLGAYCANVLNMKASTDAGVTWVPFQPTENSTRIRASASFAKGLEFTCFLTPDDWGHINSFLADGYEPSAAARFVSRAHHLFNSGDCRQAFIVGVTALEVAIGEFSRKNLGDPNQSEWNSLESALHVKQRFVAVAALSGLLSKSEMEAGLSVIRIRNEIVHDGGDVPEDMKPRQFYEFLAGIGKLLHGPGFKFPFAGGNCQMSPDLWDKLAES